MIASPDLYRYSVAEYHRLLQSGVLGPTARVELIEGLLVAKMTRNPPHDVALSLIGPALSVLLPTDWIVRVQSAITLKDSEPEPDIVIARGPARRYRVHHPGASEIAMILEVSEASLSFDQGEKMRVYARARLPIYWIVNLIDEQIEVYQQPRAGKSPGYRQVDIYEPDEQVPFVISGQEIARMLVRDLLP